MILPRRDERGALHRANHYLTQSAAEAAQDLSALQDTIVACRRCPRLLAWRERVSREKTRRYRTEEYWGKPVPGFGEPGAALVIIGLAPAAHGGNRTGRMFTGDKSGDWLCEALHRFGFANQPCSIQRADGLRLRSCWITAAVRCAPPANRPLTSELNACRPYLVRELQLFASARVFIALGHIAFHSFLKAWRESGGRLPDEGLCFSHGGEWGLPGGKVLISSYHPSQQNTLTGRLTRPMFHGIFREASQVLGDR
jgi:uracil-DNA glycosylase family 4